MTNCSSADGSAKDTSALSAPTLYRVLIGLSGTDGGSNPPFGISRYMVVVGMGAEGLVSAATLAIPGSASAIVPQALDFGGSSLTGLQLTGSPVYGVLKDDGRGKPALFWDTVDSTLTAGAVLVFFNGSTGRVTSVIASVGTVAASSAGAVGTCASASGGQVFLHGAFTAAFDATDPERNQISGTASEVVLDEATGSILSVKWNRRSFR